MTNPDNNTAITMKNLSKTFRIYKERDRSLKRHLLRQRQGVFEEFHTSNDVTLSIPRGSAFGLLGQDGSGKSTLLKCIAKVLTPDSGHTTSTGRMAAMLEVGSGFHPDLSGREDIYLNGAILSMSRKEIEKKFDEVMAFFGVEKFIDQPVKNYSSGMYVRLGFAVSIHVEPEILLVDEILAVGDLESQERCLNEFAQFCQEGRTVVVVSHALEMMRTFCDKATWLNHGKLVTSGSAASIVDRYSNMAHGAVRAEEGGTRFDSGETKVTKMEWIGPQRTDTRKVHTDDPITIHLHYECLQAIKRPAFGAPIDTREGFWVQGHHNLDDSFVPEVLLPGTGSADITIPHLPLRPATYYLSASVQNFEVNQVINAWQKGVALDVLPQMGMESGGVVAFGSHSKNLCPPAEMAKPPVRDEAYWQELAAHTGLNAADNAQIPGSPDAGITVGWE